MRIYHNRMFTNTSTCVCVCVCVCVCDWMLLLCVNKFIPKSSYKWASQVPQW